MSESLWTGPTITASGKPWGDTPKKIGIANITAKILCERHNSALSPVDAAGASAFQTLTRSIELVHARRFVGGPWMLQWFGINGPLLERWFLKTAINVSFVVRASPTWELPHEPGEPPPLLVRAAYGQEELPRPMGLYAAARVGQSIASREEVVVETLWRRETQVGAAFFYFRGFTFLLSVSPLPIEGIMKADGALQWQASDFSYHLRRLRNKVGDHLSHIVDFRWPGQPFDYFGDTDD
jgi:hypothetical protein